MGDEVLKKLAGPTTVFPGNSTRQNGQIFSWVYKIICQLPTRSKILESGLE
jgi:hypothetical protein